MQISVTSRHMDVSTALKARAQDVVTALLDKYFGHGLSAEVVFSKGAGGFSCLITVHVHRNLELQASDETGDAHTSLDQAAEKLAKRLRRYKRKLNDHRGLAEEAETRAARAVVFEAAEVDQGDDNESEAEPSDFATIVAERQTEIQRLTVAQAVARLDLSGLNALLFESDGRVNLVYRRNDGNIGWIDPGQ
ncbi:MAG: ribosomal subunit interface protein [Geminicoccus sp.]|nr:ribosomal subunit interface protein [Geminicoccus sp.]HCI00136.1 ribosome-associated translation inhibitor RaiA [Alphaproteobacteria bacterium]|tara:strand:- start:3215 stop:3790 length:576 start_codon:yes stop_codon:yes gene_type:complete